MNKKSKIESLFVKQGFKNFRRIEPSEIEVSQWVRMKCVFGCSGYGKGACCPPEVPSVEDCKAFINEYSEGYIIHKAYRLDDPESRHTLLNKENLKLLKIEREVFLAGYHKVFLLFMGTCHICKVCENLRAECKNSRNARPTAEAMSIDVFSTAEKFGFPIRVLSDYDQSMNRYAFLLVK